jgi:hypothetical protein
MGISVVHDRRRILLANVINNGNHINIVPDRQVSYYSFRRLDNYVKFILENDVLRILILPCPSPELLMQC